MESRQLSHYPILYHAFGHGIEITQLPFGMRPSVALSGHYHALPSSHHATLAAGGRWSSPSCSVAPLPFPTKCCLLPTKLWVFLTKSCSFACLHLISRSGYERHLAVSVLITTERGANGEIPKLPAPTFPQSKFPSHVRRVNEHPVFVCYALVKGRGVLPRGGGRILANLPFSIRYLTVLR